MQRTGALQRPGALQEYCRSRTRSAAAPGSVTGALQVQGQVSGARFVTSSRYQDRSQGRICDVARVCYVDRVPGTLQGSDLLHYNDVAGAYLVAREALQECCRSRIRSVAESGSVTGALQGQDQVSRARFVTLSRYQDRSRGRIRDLARVCYVDRVPGLLQGSDLLRYGDVAGACLVAKNVRFPA